MSKKNKGNNPKVSDIPVNEAAKSETPMENEEVVDDNHGDVETVVETETGVTEPDKILTIGEPLTDSDDKVALGFQGVVFDSNPMITRPLNAALKSLHGSVAITPATGAKQQVAIYRAVIRVLGTSDRAAVKEFLDGMLKYIVDNSEWFSPVHGFKYFNELPGFSEAMQREFECLLRLLIDTAPPATRKDIVGRINWVQIEDALTSINGGAAFNSLQVYYNV